MAKKLLKESTIRRFQKLANVGSINENYFMNEEEELEDAEAAEGGEEMDMGAEEAPEFLNVDLCSFPST